jgi:hypothetical protein
MRRSTGPVSAAAARVTQRVCVSLALACTLALVGCAQLSGDTAVARTATQADLAAMVLPRADLGPLAENLAVDDDSGPRANKKAAADTLDPRDTAETLKRAGRLWGYDLSYTDPNGARSAISTREGVIAVGTGVELFRDALAAAAHLAKQVDDFERFRGKTVEGTKTKLAAVEPFEADAGEDSYGIQATLLSGDVALYANIVSFRRGRIVGGAFSLLPTDRDVAEEVERIAGALDRRIEGVLRGEIREEPVALPAAPKADGLDPRLLALRAEDLGLRTSRVREDYIDVGAVRAYLREFDIGGGRLGGSKVAYVRAAAQVYPTPRDAEREQAYSVSGKGSARITRRFLAGFFRTTGFTPAELEVRALDSPARDSATFQFFFKAPKGQVEGVFLSVIRGRVRGTITVIGLANEVNPADVFALAEKIRKRLRN